MRVSAEYVVLEETLRLVLDNAKELAGKESLTESESGELFAYFWVLDWAKQMADALEVDFLDRELEDLDPYSLLSPSRRG